MGKVALSRKANSDAFELVSRDICENPENGYIQIIAAVTLIDRKHRILTYKRAAGITEERLAGKLSCIIGGHIEELPEEGTHPTEGSFLFNNAMRELDEEFPGLREKIDEISEKERVLAMWQHIPSFTNISDVEKVHEAAVLYVMLPDLDMIMDGLTFNRDEIESIHLINVDDIDEVTFHKDITIDEKDYMFENWTAYVVNQIKNNFDFYGFNR
jgi:predicted NUDIX family phosphoesterase